MSYKIFFLLIFSLCLHATELITVDNAEALSMAKKLDNSGKLCKKKKGYIYLKVDDAYIHTIAPLLTIPSSSIVPQKLGAHISIFYEKELDKNTLSDLDEIGEYYTFAINKLQYLKRGKARLYLLSVKSKSLENLRKKYGLSPLLKNHAFHITLGYEDPSYISNPVFIKAM